MIELNGIRINVRVDKGANERKNQSSLRKNNLSIISVLFEPFSFKLKYLSLFFSKKKQNEHKCSVTSTFSTPIFYWTHIKNI